MAKKKFTPIPLPPGFRGGGKTGITAALLDKHENLVTSTLRAAQETAKLAALRLKNRIEAAGRDWQPPSDFINDLKSVAQIAATLSAEYRQLMKAKSADDLSDEELGEMLKPLVLTALAAMSDEEFAELLDEHASRRSEAKRLAEVAEAASGDVIDID